MGVELSSQSADMVRGMQWIVGVDEGFGGGVGRGAGAVLQDVGHGAVGRFGVGV